MTMTSENTESIFIHSLFRSGSTFVYNAIKRTETFHIYHEPFHEVIASLPAEWADFASRTSQLKDLLRHDFLSGGYFDEYAPLLEEIKSTFEPEISYNLYFLDEQDDAPRLKSYIDILIKGSGSHRPVLQCTRTSGRIPWLKKNYPSRHVFLARNPWDQWFSYKVDAYISQTPQIVYSQPRLPEVLQAVMAANGFTPLAGNSLLEMRSYCAKHPVMPAVDYSLFFGLWLFSFLAAQKECDLFLNMDAINLGRAEQIQAENDLARIGLGGVSLHDYNLHRTKFKTKELGFYQPIETRVLEIFKQNGEYEDLLPLAEQYFESERKNSFTDSLAADVNPKSIFEDAARLRSNLISTGKDEAHLAGLLNDEVESLTSHLTEEQKEREALAAKVIDEMKEREALAARLIHEQQERQLLDFRLADNEQKLKSLKSQLDEITSSKFWKLGLQLQRNKDLIAPPNSSRDRAARWILNAVMFPSRRRKNRRLLADVELIASSGLFDASWYLKNNQDVAAANVDPMLHYLERGAFEGRDPGPDFSSHWYLKNNPDVARLGVNPLAHYLKYGIKEGRRPAPFTASIKPRSEAAEGATPASQFTVFTICSRNFTAYAKTLFESISQYHPNAEMFMVLCDDVDSDYLKEDFPFKIITLSELDISNVQEMAQRYNITEFNTAIKPFAFSYLFNKLEKEKVLYLDPDIILLSPLEEVVNEFSRGAECILTPHILEPAENAEMSDNKFLQYGIYNLGFVGFRKTADVLRIIEWWSRQLVDKCVINLAEGLFVDQKWADLFPAFLKQTAVLHHPGYNVAYWNLSQRTVEFVNDHWYSNRIPLRFVHFSGNNLNDPYFLSRHSGTQTRDNIGDLNYLLKSYRERLFQNGHAEYSKIPYSFSWHGTSGINLHTPKPYDPDSTSFNLPLTLKNTKPGNQLIQKLSHYWKLTHNTAVMSGGWLHLGKKVLRAFRQGGISTIRHRAHLMSSIAETMTTSIRSTPIQRSEISPIMRWMSRVLIIDSATPRPDRDAGSLSTFNLIKIYLDLGYDVTFIPSDLLYLGEYTESLHELGVRCLQRPEIDSIQQHLQKEGSQYDFVILCRAPIASLYIADIRRYAPNAKIILDTIDLHYLREEREAKLDGSSNKIKTAEETKKWELDLIRQCDVTIVLSSVEEEILKKELDNVDIRLIPLIFVENVYEIPGFEDRKDFLFIGGFPHLPNVDAVIYFCNEVLPLIRIDLPDVKFHIIGNAPPPEVLELANREGVIVHGFLKDVTPMFRTCRLSVAPLRYGAGIKGKIATSMAYGVPVIATSLAVEGMDIEADKHVLVADHPKQFADAFIRAYESAELWNQLSENGRHQALRIYSATAGYRRISNLMKDINPKHNQIDLYTLRSLQEYDLLCETIDEEIKEHKTIELDLIENIQPGSQISGFCIVCGKKNTFNMDFSNPSEATDGEKFVMYWRDSLICSECGFASKTRAAIHIFYQKLKPAKDSAIYITERSTPLFSWLKERHNRLIGGDHFGDAALRRVEMDSLQAEESVTLPFPDSTFDYVLSIDRIEHIGEGSVAALKELFRCLKPGGTIMFTAPSKKEQTKKQFASQILSGDSAENSALLENYETSMDEEVGAADLHSSVWALLDDMHKAGFQDPRLLNYWARDFAYLGGEQFIFVADKRSA